MEGLKQEALNDISKMPDTTEIDDIIYRLYVIDQLRKGRETIQRGETESIEDLKKEIESWQNRLFQRELISDDFRKTLQRIHPRQALDRSGLFFML